MTYLSKTKQARRLESAQRRERDRKREAQVNEIIAPLIWGRELMKMIVNGEVEVKVRKNYEKSKPK